MILDKLPPQNIEAEESVLSALFINNQGFEDIEFLKPDDFYKSANKTIFNTMLTLHKKKEPVDLVTVAQHLISKDQLENIGGGAYLSHISDSAPVATNIKHYGNIIHNIAVTRELITRATRIIENGYSVKNIDDYISQSQQSILEIQTTSSRDKIYNMETLMLDALDRIEKAQTQEKTMGMQFGMPTLDIFSNIFGSKLFLIAARPGMGKTALALSIARHLAKQQIKVGFLSIEMDKESLSDRLLSIESDVNALCFYAKESLSKQSKQTIDDAANYLSTLPIYIDDADCKIQDVERKCRKLKKLGCEIIFIDQLSKIKGDSKKSKFEIYTDNCAAIALLKKELRMPIGLLCQLNRNVEARSDKIPEMSDLKQTGMLEEDADLIFFIFRPGYYDKKKDEAQTQIILAKNRQGAKGVEEKVLFNKKRGMFSLI
jgi:replicative DNA helicase